MTETAVILDFDTKSEKLQVIEKKMKIGRTGKAKLSNMKKLLERNSEQLKQKIVEYFEGYRKILDERETKLLNKVNLYLDCRITELEDKLKCFQEKINQLNEYQCCLEDEVPSNHLIFDDFDHFVAASRYDFHVEKNNALSFKKVGVLKEVDVLVARLDSSDEDESDDDDASFCKDSISSNTSLKKFNKAVETELSDAASSCSVLSYKEGEEDNKDNKVENVEYVDDYEFLTFEVENQPIHVKPVQVGKKWPTNSSSNLSETKLDVEKLVDAFKNGKMNISPTISKITDQITAEQKAIKTTANEGNSLPQKVVNSIKMCHSRNEQKDTSVKELSGFKNCFISIQKTKDDPSQELQIHDSINARAIKSTDHISNFNSQVKIILDKGASKMQNSIC